MSKHIYFRKSFRLWDNVEKYCRDGQNTEDNILKHLRTVSWIPKATNPLSECVILSAFSRQHGLHKLGYMLRLVLLNLYILLLRQHFFVFTHLTP